MHMHIDEQWGFQGRALGTCGAISPPTNTPEPARNIRQNISHADALLLNCHYVAGRIEEALHGACEQACSPESKTKPLGLAAESAAGQAEQLLKRLELVLAHLSLKETQ